MSYHESLVLPRTLHGVNRTLALQEERDDIDEAERHERDCRTAAIVATCVGPLELLAFAIYHWQSAWPTTWILVLLTLVLFVGLLWVKWFRAVDGVTVVLQEESRLLPNGRRLGMLQDH